MNGDQLYKIRGTSYIEGLWGQACNIAIREDREGPRAQA